MTPTTPLSILELVRITEQTDARQAIHNARDLAVHAERWGYHRVWVAEHHNIPGIGSSATSLVIGFIAEGTRTIRVGAGGIMLPNHAPYIVAEQFGTLERLYPGRSTWAWGVRRAPTSARCGPCAARCRPPRVFPRTWSNCRPSWPRRRPARASRRCWRRARKCHCGSWGPAAGAMLAAELGLPYAFARISRRSCWMRRRDLPQLPKPSAQLSRPHAMVGVNIIAADTDDQARYLPPASKCRLPTSSAAPAA